MNPSDVSIVAEAVGAVSLLALGGVMWMSFRMWYRGLVAALAKCEASLAFAREKWLLWESRARGALEMLRVHSVEYAPAAQWDDPPSVVSGVSASGADARSVGTRGIMAGDVEGHVNTGTQTIVTVNVPKSVE